MGQGFTLACEPCYCGVLALPTSGNMLPGSYPDSDGADKEEPISTHKIGKETDDNIFQQLEQPRDEPDRNASPEAAGQDCVGTVSKSTGPPSVAFSQQSKQSRLRTNSAELRRRSRIRRCIWHHAQQPESAITLPYWAYAYCCQMVLTTSILLAFLVLGVVLMSQSGSLHEVSVPYTANMTEQEFTIDQAFQDDVLVYYDINIVANHKSFVENKDRRVVYTFLSVATCTAADSRAWVRMRRGSDTTFVARVEAAAGDDLAPCGLVSLSTFTDNFTFHQATDNGWERLEANESDIALESDADAYGKLHPPLEGEERFYILESDQRRETWLTPGFFEHWKVWYRTPVAPHVRNLWAVIKGGLPQGSYKVQFVENSPVWHDWGVAEKRLIFAQRHSLGNRGALGLVGGLCLMLAGLEAIALAAMLLTPRCRSSRPAVQPERQNL
ncbi:chat-1 [Symbiodinium pilosum]|uniref:Chat-1 protein n=1 Tax=Symbiodinium pilosum TaxID=2952 RepID=A0A812WSN8_SYMPI|nr:chat-1 [Symbiodinium pilosum]